MLVKFNCKNANLWNITIEAMEKKIEARFSRYFDVDDVVVNVKVTEQKLGFKVELTMPYLGQQLRAEVTDKESPLAAFDKGMDVLERQMSKCKTKLKRNKRHLPEVPAAPAEFAEDDTDYEVVRTKNYEMKPMTVQDAILNMEMLGHTFYMFYDTDAGCYATVYKRDDGAYGLIVPK